MNWLAMKPLIIILSFVILAGSLLTACDEYFNTGNTNPLHLPPQGFVGNSVEGKKLFQQNCQSCHGLQGQGTNQGPPLVNNIYNPRHHANLAFNLAVKNGVRSHHWKYGDMKPLPGVSPEMVEHIIQYIRKLQKQAGIT